MTLAWFFIAGMKKHLARIYNTVVAPVVNWYCLPRLILTASLIFFIQFAKSQQPVVFSKLNSNQRLLSLCNLAEADIFKIDNADAANKKLDSIGKIARQLDDKRMFWYSEYFKKLYFVKRATDSSAYQLDLLTKMRPWVNDCPVNIIKAVYQLNLGSAQYDCLQYSNAFDNFLNAEKAFKETGFDNVPEIGHYLVELQYRYYNFGDDSNTIRVGKMADLYPPFLDNLKISVLHTIGLSYYNLHNVDSAHTYFAKAMDIAVARKVTDWQGIITATLSRVAFDRRDYANALDFGKQSIKLCLAYKYYTNAALSCLRIATIYARQHNTDSSLLYYNVALQHAAKNPDINFNAAYFEYLALYYFATGDKERAYSSKHMLQSLLDSFNTLKSIAITKSLDERLRVEKNTVVVQLAHQHNQTVATRIMMITLFAGLLLFVSVIYLNQRNRRLQLQYKIQNQKNEILEIERVQFIKDLDYSKAQMDEYVRKIKEKSDIIDKAAEALKDLSDPNSDASENNLDNLQDLHKLTILTEDEWDEFKNIFNKVYPNFLRNLQVRYPQFTAGEVRLLTLFKLQLTNKEIASMIGISVTSVNKSKYRLKKKIGDLGFDEDPEAFVERITV